MSASRRTSPRLAGYYAARAAAAEQRASAFALVDSVLAFKPAAASPAPAEPGKRRSPRLAVAVATEAKRTSPRLTTDPVSVPAEDNALFVRLMRMASGVLYGVFATGAYGACDPCDEETWKTWISAPQNARMVANTVLAWIRADPVRARRMGETEVEEALLEGDVWVTVMRALSG